MKFRELARIFKDVKLTAPVYDDEHSDDRRKQKGVVRFEDSIRFLEILVSRFGGMSIRDIKHSDLENFKFERSGSQNYAAVVGARSRLFIENSKSCDLCSIMAQQKAF
jgi:hypothetical protein